MNPLQPLVHIDLQIQTKMAKISAAKSDNFFVIAVEIPLMDKYPWICYKLIPYKVLYIEGENLFGLLLKPKARYLVVQTVFNRCYLASPEYIDRCLPAGGELACFPDTPVEFISESRDCGIDIFKITINNETTTCDVQLLQENSTQWIVLVNENAWLFSTFRTEYLKTSCEGKLPHTIKFNGTGLLRFSPNCIAENNHITLLSLGDDSFELTGLSAKKSFRIDSKYPKFYQLTTDKEFFEYSKPSLVLSQSSTGDSLEAIEAQLKEISLKYTNEMSLYIMVYISISFISFIILKVIIILCYKFRTYTKITEIRLVSKNKRVGMQVVGNELCQSVQIIAAEIEESVGTIKLKAAARESMCLPRPKRYVCQ